MVTARLTTDDGISIEVDVPAEDYEAAIATTLRAIRRSSASGQVPSEEALSDMVGRLSQETVEYLALLVHNPDGLEDEEIKDRLNIDNSRRLAGMNGAITKVAASVGIPEGVNIIEKDVSRQSDGSRTYHYLISEIVRPQLEELLPEPEPEPIDIPRPRPEDDVPF